MRRLIPLLLIYIIVTHSDGTQTAMSFDGMDQSTAQAMEDQQVLNDPGASYVFTDKDGFDAINNVSRAINPAPSLEDRVFELESALQSISQQTGIPVSLPLAPAKTGSL